MRDQKLFIGSGIRRLRDSQGMTQAELARKLRISTAYLSQMETNQRPVSASVLFGLGRLFGAAANELVSEDPERLATDLREALCDPLFQRQEMMAVDARALALSAPWLAHRFLDLHAAYSKLREELADSGTERTEGMAMDLRVSALQPFEEVRDFFLYTDNYCDRLDRAAEALAVRCFGDEPAEHQPLATYLADRHGVRCRLLGNEDDHLRSFDRKSRVLALNGFMQPWQRLFQMASQIAWLDQIDAIEEIVKEAALSTVEARNIAKAALANYFAGALMMPYQRFRAAALSERHDLIRLSRLFNASIEQVCHRLSTLQRPGLKGVPVYFVKVDRAGTIVKRHNANRFQFARFGGGCPLWNVHEAFEAPDRIHVQKAELPDGSLYLCLATCVTKDVVRHGGPLQRYALGLGCALPDARHFVYADHIDLASNRAVARIGVSCRLCPRLDCNHRSVPPVARGVLVDGDRRDTLPYRIE